VADDLTRTRRWSQRTDPRTALRTAVVWEVLDTLLAARAEQVGRPLDVVDVGGGTGGFAVPLAESGHRVTVVDPSPDALAALARRAAEAGVAGTVRPVQGDAGELAALVGAGTADAVLCHGVLEYVDDPATAVDDAVAILRPGGLLSLLVAQRLGAFLARALAGRFADAVEVLSGAGRAGEHDPVHRRFDREAVLALLDRAGVAVEAVHGVRLVTDLLPGALVDADPDTGRALLDLERLAGDHPRYPELLAMAAALHVVARHP
jgi:S-adenosylmethionine-dependent methyltransferase